jgi:hypothetical protein
MEQVGAGGQRPDPDLRGLEGADAAAVPERRVAGGVGAEQRGDLGDAAVTCVLVSRHPELAGHGAHQGIRFRNDAGVRGSASSCQSTLRRCGARSRGSAHSRAQLGLARVHVEAGSTAGLEALRNSQPNYCLPLEQAGMRLG